MFLVRIEIHGPREATASTSQPTPVARQEPAGAPAPVERPGDDHSRREADLIRRERALTGSEGLLDAGVAEVERREKKLAEMESALQERLGDLDGREVTIERREIELETTFGIREDRIEARESELAELDERLRRKEDDLARYVGQVQAQLAQRG